MADLRRVRAHPKITSLNKTTPCLQGAVYYRMASGGLLLSNASSGLQIAAVAEIRFLEILSARAAKTDVTFGRDD